MMIGFGCSLQLNRFGKHMKQPKGIIIGFLSQFVIMPFLCWFLTEHGNLEDHLNVALILIGCCPGGAGSNMICYIFQMDIELSVAMTTCSSIAAIGLMPLNCYIYLEWMKNISFEFDWIGLIVSCLVVVFGTLFGMLINLKFSRYACKLEKLGIISMVGIGLGTFINNSMSDVQLWNYKPSYIYLLTAAPFVLGFIIGFIISFATKLNKASCIAVATETGLQNSVLAVAVISLTFKYVLVFRSLFHARIVHVRICLFFFFFSFCLIQMTHTQTKKQKNKEMKSYVKKQQDYQYYTVHFLWYLEHYFHLYFFI